MSNLLSIPFKRTYTVEIQHAARAYIADHGGDHPDEFREDIKTWQSLRGKATTDNVHDGGIDAILLSVVFNFIPQSAPLTMGTKISRTTYLDSIQTTIGCKNDLLESKSVKRADVAHFHRYTCQFPMLLLLIRLQILRR